MLGYLNALTGSSYVTNLTSLPAKTILYIKGIRANYKLGLGKEHATEISNLYATSTALIVYITG